MYFPLCAINNLHVIELMRDFLLGLKAFCGFIRNRAFLKAQRVGEVYEQAG